MLDKAEGHVIFVLKHNQEQGNAVEPFLMESPLADAMRSGVAM
jgi:hypothetical protein